MEIKMDESRISIDKPRIDPELSMERLVPKINTFDNHFVLVDTPIAPSDLNLFNDAIKKWKEIENFEFQKMDVDKFWKRLIL